MSEFLPAYNNSMSHEGLYSNDPRDRGGESWKGIARNMNPDWEGWAVIDEIKANTNANNLQNALRADEELETMVQAFYQANYFDEILLGQIKEQDVANEMFDTAINQGTSTSVRQLQESLNLLNNNQKYYSDINEDGKTGPATLNAYSAYMLTANFPGRSIEQNVAILIKAMNGLQYVRYVEICENNPEQEVYFYGWVNRV